MRNVNFSRILGSQISFQTHTNFFHSIARKYLMIIYFCNPIYFRQEHLKYLLINDYNFKYFFYQFVLQQYKQKKKMLGFIIIMMILVPFMIMDFMYVFNEDPCINKSIFRFNIAISLKVWLLVNAAMELITILYTCAIVIAEFFKINGDRLKAVNRAIANIYILFKSAWLIVGSFLFWGDLYHTNTCTLNINTYMWATLIIKYLTLGLLYMILKNETQTEYLIEKTKGYTVSINPLAINNTDQSSKFPVNQLTGQIYMNISKNIINPGLKNQNN